MIEVNSYLMMELTLDRLIEKASKNYIPVLHILLKGAAAKSKVQRQMCP
jgi:hypothetical protein